MMLQIRSGDSSLLLLILRPGDTQAIIQYLPINVYCEGGFGPFPEGALRAFRCPGNLDSRAYMYVLDCTRQL